MTQEVLKTFSTLGSWKKKSCKSTIGRKKKIKIRVKKINEIQKRPRIEKN